MPNYESQALETVVRKSIIGIDGTGATHRFDARTRTIYVISDEEIERTEHLSMRHLSEWISYVADQRSWRELRYTDRSFTDHLIDTLGDAQ